MCTTFFKKKLYYVSFTNFVHKNIVDYQISLVISSKVDDKYPSYSFGSNDHDLIG